MAPADRDRRWAASVVVVMTQVSASEIKRVVVRGTNWVGDSVMTLPALRALRRVLPQAEITLVVRPSATGIFADVDFIDHLVPKRV